MSDRTRVISSTPPRLQIGGQLDPRKHLYIVRADIAD